MAMSEAAKLFDSKQATSGSKQDAVNGAAMTVMKLMVQSKLSGAVGGGNSGGLGSMMSLVSLDFKDLEWTMTCVLLLGLQIFISKDNKSMDLLYLVMCIVVYYVTLDVTRCKRGIF